MYLCMGASAILSRLHVQCICIHIRIRSGWWIYIHIHKKVTVDVSDKAESTRHRAKRKGKARAPTESITLSSVIITSYVVIPTGTYAAKCPLCPASRAALRGVSVFSRGFRPLLLGRLLRYPPPRSQLPLPLLLSANREGRNILDRVSLFHWYKNGFASNIMENSGGLPAIPVNAEAPLPQVLYPRYSGTQFSSYLAQHGIRDVHPQVCFINFTYMYFGLGHFGLLTNPKQLTFEHPPGREVKPAAVKKLGYALVPCLRLGIGPTLPLASSWTTAALPIEFCYF
ncbi:hypothetical protein K438DRAFT_1767374 [Mycena galopus ATCC 62051]|nr:hypothetical protein K438DRAFT_1767374 [Mycena galopus ATCC 62051]